MIPRYSREEMSAIWADKNRFTIWQEIETCAAEAMAQCGIIPVEAAQNIRKKGNFDIKRINEIEAETHHDVIAFLTSMQEFIGEDARFLHQGMTSSDVLDTALSVQLTQAVDILLKDLDRVLAAFKKQAFSHKFTPTIGRSHGIYAEPVTFGLKMAGFYAEFARNKKRLLQAREEIAVCAISGAVGTYAHLTPLVEEKVAEKLGLTAETISTQVIPRDRHAALFNCLALIGSSVERVAIEIRHLQRSDVREAQEYFAQGQKGSSAMPHKRNPILSENLTGLARIVRMAVVPALENVALWHERDISHSSVERVIGPDVTIALDFALHRMAGMIDKLLVHDDIMQANLDKSYGIFHSQRVMLALTQKGMAREDAYKLVQATALQAWDGKTDFISLLAENTVIKSRLDKDMLAELNDIGYHFRHVEHIFARVFEEK
ncbi:MAG: adenylosuccinate lyase [Alphaproteobacteria bacterium]|nr:adenylosuccinate lyase [Alphaproteobacteria bacterium]